MRCNCALEVRMSMFCTSANSTHTSSTTCISSIMCCFRLLLWDLFADQMSSIADSCMLSLQCFRSAPQKTAFICNRMAPLMIVMRLLFFFFITVWIAIGNKKNQRSLLVWLSWLCDEWTFEICVKQIAWPRYMSRANKSEVKLCQSHHVHRQLDQQAEAWVQCAKN